MSTSIRFTDTPEDFARRRARGSIATQRGRAVWAQLLAARSYDRSRGTTWEQQAADGLFDILVARGKISAASKLLQERLEVASAALPSPQGGYNLHRYAAHQWERLGNFPEAEWHSRRRLACAANSANRKPAMVGLATLLVRRERYFQAAELFAAAADLGNANRYSPNRREAAHAYAQAGGEHLLHAQHLIRKNLALVGMNDTGTQRIARQELRRFDDAFGTATSPDLIYGEGWRMEICAILSARTTDENPDEVHLLLKVGERTRRPTVVRAEAVAARVRVTPGPIVFSIQQRMLAMIEDEKITGLALIDDDNLVHRIGDSTARGGLHVEGVPLAEVLDTVHAASNGIEDAPWLEMVHVSDSFAGSAG